MADRGNRQLGTSALGTPLTLFLAHVHWMLFLFGEKAEGGVRIRIQLISEKQSKVPFEHAHSVHSVWPGELPPWSSGPEVCCIVEDGKCKYSLSTAALDKGHSQAGADKRPVTEKHSRNVRHHPLRSGSALVSPQQVVIFTGELLGQSPPPPSFNLLVSLSLFLSCL